MSTAKEYADVWLWLEQNQPGASVDDLQKVAEKAFGPTKWDSQMGYGEGAISCSFPSMNVTGWSCGLCTREEALMNAVISCLVVLCLKKELLHSQNNIQSMQHAREEA